MDFVISFIRRIRRKMNRSIMIESVIKTMLWGTMCMLFVMLLSLVVPIVSAPLIGAVFVLLSFFVGIFIGIKRRVSEREAALYIDGFGFKEKIITAYEMKDREENVYLLQREDAISTLRKRSSEVKTSIKVPWTRLGIILIMLALIFAASVLPTPAKIKAKETAITKQEAKKAEKDTKELLDALKKIDKSQMSQEELEKLNKMMESLELSKEDMKKAKTPGELNNAKMRYDYKLEDVSKELSQMADGKTGTAAKSIKSASEMAKNQSNTYNMVASNQENNGENPNGENGQNGENQNGQNQNGENQNGENQNGQNQNGENQNGQNQNGQNQNGENQNGQGQNGQNQNGQNGQNQSGDNGQNGQNGNGQNGQGQNGQSGNGNGNGQNGQSGQNGNGGNGGNGGSGSGQGNGTNEHEVQHNHDYVSIDEHINGKYGDNSTSEYSKEQNGLAWNGKKVPYDTVINDYSNAAYDGIEKGKYPGSMSKVIKEYFSGLEN